MLKNLLALFFITSSLCASSQTKKSKPKAANTSFDIQISGKLLNDCHKPVDLYFGGFHGAEHDVKAINANANGEFKAKFSLKEPGLVYIKKGMFSQYFIATASEKTYQLDLTCSNDALNSIQVNNSKENKAYQDFLNLRKKFSTDIDSFRTKNLDDVAVFQEFAKHLHDYQTGLTLLAKQNPQTYAANHLTVADRVSEKDLVSILSLRQNYLKRQVFADPKFYNTSLPTFILENYIDFISDKNNSSFAPFDGLLNLASKNTEAAKRLEDALYDALEKSKRQDLINGYIYWAQAHPNKMVQQVVQAKLQRLAKCMVGAPLINISLKDTIGNTQQLKDVALSSKYTLLALYSPGCSHCQETLPKLGPIAEQYKSKGFKIFTVAANTGNAEWIGFIKKYMGSGWINVMEGPNNNSFGEYVLTTLPSFVLIDSKRKIVSKMDAQSVLTDLQKYLDKD
ncbi:thioredoxin-like domain-containing protein [Flavobacterium sp.]|uniref:TlpA family protein disulfide reductase n=1 Tax=Flavobacterium sp. TaxID=239 RepID=UPI00286D1FB9|nr:thioredoxin-like domain-containing protein [Flavobacterium sp.]